MNVVTIQKTLLVDFELDSRERQWLELLDRLGRRDIQTFTRFIQSRKEDGRRRPASVERIYRSTAKTSGENFCKADPVYQHRRDWLQFWIYYYADGSRTTIEAMLGYGKSYVAQCLDNSYQSGRSIGDRAARLIEMRLGRPAKSMDKPFFPFWDIVQNIFSKELNEEQRNWLKLLDGLDDDQVREFTIMVHAQRQHNLELMRRYGFFTAPSRPIPDETPIDRNKFENRRSWLRHWIDIYAGGKNRAFAEKIGVSWSVPSQYLSTTYLNGRGLSDKAARRIEHALGMEDGMMDKPFHANSI